MAAVVFEKRPARTSDPKRHALHRFEQRNFFVAYHKAADRLREGDLTVQFPQGCFPPGLPYVPTLADLLLEPG